MPSTKIKEKTSEQLHQEAVKIFVEGWDNFLDKTNIKKSFYSSREITWLNDVSIAMGKASKSKL